MSYLDKECKGCHRCHRIDLERESVCVIKPQHAKGNCCPCLNCIVKSMCSEVCEEYITFKTKYLDYLNQQQYNTPRKNLRNFNYLK